MRRTVWIAVSVLLLSASSVAACTGVVISRDGTTIVGGNEDWFRPDAYYWASRPIAGLHGAVYFGYLIDGEFGDYPAYWYEFQGINDAGLYFDSFSAPCGVPPDDLMKPVAHARMERQIMQTCETVEEAVALLTRYSRSFMDCMQYLLVDRTGAAAVVEAGGVVWKDGDTFAVTNFHLSSPEDGYYPCTRYETAMDMLSCDSEASADRVAEILDAAHTESTQYTLVCDLTNGQIHIYRIGNFTRKYAINLAELWSQSSDPTPFSTLQRAVD